MDPNAALAEIREIIEKWGSGAIPDENADQALGIMAAHVEALDEWITSGGFLPDAWQNRA